MLFIHAALCKIVIDLLLDNIIISLILFNEETPDIIICISSGILDINILNPYIYFSQELLDLRVKSMLVKSNDIVLILLNLISSIQNFKSSSINHEMFRIAGNLSCLISLYMIFER